MSIVHLSSVIDCVTLLHMTSKQKRIIAALVVANTIVVLVMTVLVTRPSGTAPSLPQHSYTPTLPRTRALSQESCQWKATQLMAQAGLGGTVALTPGGSLRFEIACTLAPGQTADEAAQLVWTAFDVALALDEDECGSFTQVEVAILAQGIQTDTHISASVSTADLTSFGADELSENEFIKRVTYSNP